MQDERKPKQVKALLSRILPARLRRADADTASRTGAGHATQARDVVPSPGTPSTLSDALSDIIARVPKSGRNAVTDATAEAQRVARAAAHRAALVSGSLALPPGPLGMLTIVPDLYLIWKLQRQMVADIFALHGRSAELTRRNMVYCLFRHLASQVVRDVAVRTAERAALNVAKTAALQSTATALGMHITRRIAGATAGRWIPVAGAAAVGAYAYWDTLQVAKAALRVLNGQTTPPALPDLEAGVPAT